jgi:hypothetical protein
MSSIGCSSVSVASVTEIATRDVSVGDVLFFHSASSAEGVIRGYTFGDYTHCGVVVHFDDGFADARNFEEVRLSVVDEVQRTGCLAVEVPVVVHVDRGLEIARPQQLCLAPLFRDEPDRHIDVRRPVVPVDGGAITRAALAQVGLVYDFGGLVTGGLQVAEGYGKFDKVAEASLLFHALVRAIRSAREADATNGLSSGESEHWIAGATHQVFDLLKGLIPGVPKRACSDFVLHCFANGNANSIGSFPKSIALHPTLLREFGGSVGDMGRNMDAGGNHEINVDPANCIRDASGACVSGPHHHSRIRDLASIRRRNLVTQLVDGIVDVGEFLHDYPHCAPTNIFDATGFEETTYRIDFDLE